MLYIMIYLRYSQTLGAKTVDCLRNIAQYSPIVLKLEYVNLAFSITTKQEINIQAYVGVRKMHGSDGMTS